MKRNIFITLALLLALTAKGQMDRFLDFWLEIDKSSSSYMEIGVYINNRTADMGGSWWYSYTPIIALSFDIDFPTGIIGDEDRYATLHGLSHHNVFVTPYVDNSCRSFVCIIPKYEAGYNEPFPDYAGPWRICTLKPAIAYGMSDGSYQIDVSNIELVWTDGYLVDTYHTPDVSYQFEIHNGISQPPVPTDIKGIDDQDIEPADSNAPQGIYTLQGVKVEKMQHGNIYIVNGKKMMAK